MERFEEIEELQKVNEGIREQIENIMFVNNMDEEENKELWNLINELIDNEIEQEKLCD